MEEVKSTTMVETTFKSTKMVETAFKSTMMVIIKL